MKFELHMSTDNDAFAQDVQGEVARILLRLSKEISTGDAELVPNQPIRLRDVNGNRVGYAILQPDDEPSPV